MDIFLYFTQLLIKHDVTQRRGVTVVLRIQTTNSETNNTLKHTQPSSTYNRANKI